MARLSILFCSAATALYAIAPAQANGQFSIYGGMNANPPADAMSTHLEAKLDGQQVSTLLHLQFPQSYEAIKNRLGIPAYRNAEADYYRLPNGRWVMVSYNEVGKAIGFQFGN
jgi:hypothetical protein